MSEELYAQSKERIADLLEPINGGVGEDISYDEKFEEIKGETEKLSSLTGESCSWANISVIAEEIIQDKSKDFRVACYLATCKLREGTFEKVLDAMIFMREFTNTFWEDMYPPLRRIRARAGMVGWMSDQSGGVVMEIQMKPADAPMVKATDALSKELDALFREKFGDHYPGMSKLRDGFRHLIRTMPKEEPKPEPAAAPAAPAAAPGAPAGPAAVAPPPPAPVVASGGGSGPSADSINSSAEALNAVKEISKTLIKIGAVMRGEKPEEVLAYRYGRMGQWLALNKTPVVRDGQTLVPAPPGNLRSKLEGFVSANDWLALLNEADTVGAKFILWLDPQRYASTAMSALGSLFMKAKQEHLLQVALLLKRVPTLPQLVFNDGKTTFADGQTQMWIENEVLPVLAGDGGGGGGGGGGPSALDEPLKEGKDLAAKGELGKAIVLVSNAAAAAPTPAERFRGKLAVAQLCLQQGQFSIARGQAEGLTEIIREHNLTAWDPWLCGQVYATLYGAHKGANTGGVITPEARAAQEAVFDQLCQLDPAAALKLADKKK